MPWARALANLVVILHVMYVVFVVLGLAAILIGVALRWRWVRNPVFRFVHLAAIGLVVLESVTEIPCPLTILEKRLRLEAGQAGYTGDFVAYWMHKLFFFNAERWVFTLGYVLFGVAVVAAFVFAPPRVPGRGRRGRETVDPGL